VSAAISQPGHVGTADHEPSVGPGLDGPAPAEDRPDAPVGAVVVRRNAGLAALVGAAASGVAIAYLWRATQSGSALDWALCVVMAAIGAAYLANLVDARTPLLVADELGLRVRLGHQWRGLPWDAVGSVAVQPRRGWRDGRLMFAPHSLGRALDGLDARGRRAAAANQRAYGAALAVPVGLTTRVSVPRSGLVERLELLAHGRAEVVPMPAGDAAEEPREEAVAPDAPADAPADVSPESHRGREAPAAHPAEPEPGGTGTGTSIGTGTGTGTGSGTGTGTGSGSGIGTDGDEPDARPAGRRGSRSLASGLGVIASRLAPGARRDAVTPAQPDDVDEGSGQRPDVPPGDRSGAPEDRPDVTGERTDDLAGDAADPPTAPAGEPALGTPAGTTIALRGGRRGLRARVDRGEAAVLGSTALQPDGLGADGDAVRRLPEDEELRRGPQPFDDGRVRPLSRLGDPVAPLVVEDFVTEPAYDPVIGPELAAARTRVGLSVDELAERTRIRPHVIESIEVDDFAPCGGDFYARGHLRTLARVLGRDPGPLLEQFDRRYATAPVSARTVFEAELATGMTGSMRSTAGGASWPLLVGVVLALVLVWGVVRLFAAEPPETLQSPVPVLHGSQGSARHAAGPGPTGAAGAAGGVGLAARPVRLTVSAAHAASRVVVRDASGKVVWAGDLGRGASHTLRATPPVRVRAANAGAVEVSLAGRDEGTLGALGRPGRRTFDRTVR